MRKLWHHTQKLVHHPLVHHTHHLAYVVYYTYAAVMERGVIQVISGCLLLFAVATAIERQRQEEE